MFEMFIGSSFLLRQNSVSLNALQRCSKSSRTLCIRRTKALYPLVNALHSTTESDLKTVPNNSAKSDTASDALRSNSVFECSRCRSPLSIEKLKSKSNFKCESCNSRFEFKSGTFYNLTKPDNPNEPKPFPIFPSFGSNSPPAKALFTSSLVSFLYERGWRQQFEQAGFPGESEEFVMFENFIRPSQGIDSRVWYKNAVDLSCGSGFMARRIAQSGRFENVIGLDSSPSMLQESKSRCKPGSADENIFWIQSDAQILPFSSNSIDAIHAGAALHCWAQLPDVLAEIRRVLTPNGRFFATTFAEPNVPSSGVLNPRSIQYQLGSLGWNSTFRAFDPKELEFLLLGAGFVDAKVDRLRNCLVVYASKSEK